MINPITELYISKYSIDIRQKIDDTRAWCPIFDSNPIIEDQYVFIAFKAGESGSEETVEYKEEGLGEEAFWVYKTDYTVNDLLEGFITPGELINELEEEQPNIEIVGLCKYVRDIPSK